MPGRRARIRLGLAVALALAGPVAAQTLTPDEMRARAIAAAAQDDTATALALTEALIARDAGDVTALLVRSRAQRNAGDYDAALGTARVAWRAAETKGERYRAALLVAQALSSRGDRLRAQIWLRRAAQIAPGAAEKRRAVADLRHVRRQTPTSVKLRFAVAPTSNANGGASDDEVTLFGLPILLSGSALALSGTRVAFGAEIERVLAASERSRTLATLDLSHQTYRLSSEAKRRAPDASGSDFALTGVDLGLRRDISTGAGEGYWSFGGALGATWYGGDPLTRSATVSLGRTWRGAGGTLFEAEAALSRETRVETDGVTPVSLDLSFDAARGLAGGTLRLGVFASESRSDSMSFAYTSGALSAGYSLGTPVLAQWGGGVDLSVSAALAMTEFDATPYKSGGRQDRVVQGAVTAAFPGLDYYGFAPTVTVEGSQRESDVDLYDTDRLGISLGIVSTF